MAPKRKRQKSEKTLVDEEKLLNQVNSTVQVDKEKDRTFNAEEILDMRVKKGKHEYKVKWAGYDRRSCTWEPQENILDPRLMKHFEEKRAKIKDGRVKVDKKVCSAKSNIKEMIDKKQTKDKQKIPSKKMKTTENYAELKEQRMKKACLDKSKSKLTVVAKKQANIKARCSKTVGKRSITNKSEGEEISQHPVADSKKMKPIKETVKRSTIKKIKGNEMEAGTLPTSKAKCKEISQCPLADEKKTKPTKETVKRSTIKKIKRNEKGAGAMPTNKAKCKIEKITISSTAEGTFNGINASTSTDSSCDPTLNNSVKKDVSSGDVYIRKICNVGSPQEMVAPPALVAIPPRPALTTHEQSTKQKVQVKHGAGGTIQVRGLLPGQQLAQLPDGKLQIFSKSVPNTGGGQGGQLAKLGKIIATGPVQVSRQLTHQQPHLQMPSPLYQHQNTYANPSYNSQIRFTTNPPTNYNSSIPFYNPPGFNSPRHTPVPLDRLNWPLMDRQYANVSGVNSLNGYNVIGQWEDGNSCFFEDTFDYSDLPPRP